MNRRYRILIVDDDEAVRKQIIQALSILPFQFLEAEDGEIAKQFLTGDPLDLVITDITMPRFDGRQLLRFVKEHHPQAEVIVITGFATIELAVEIMKDGAFMFLQKPLNFKDLKSEVERALGLLLDPTGPAIRSNNAREGLVGRFVKSNNPAMQELFSIAKVIAPNDSTVLITGESGTGKELLAQFIHFHSQRTDGPMTPVNCGAIPENLMESEFFGHVKGAFTGAINARKGRLAAAHGGTLFLDEVGELPLPMQVKLLRALQDKSFEPVGSSKMEQSDFRVIAATNKDLEAEVSEGRFREDLYYRLNVIPLHIPPLRDRTDDILKLSNYFIERFNREKGCRISGFAEAAQEALKIYGWPGNIRELENIVERMVVIYREGAIDLNYLPPKIRTATPIAPTNNSTSSMFNPAFPEEGIDFSSAVGQFERSLLVNAMQRANGNRNLAARILNLNRTTLVEKLKKRGVE